MGLNLQHRAKGSDTHITAYTTSSASSLCLLIARGRTRAQSLASHWKKICALFALPPACPWLTDKEELFQEDSL